MGFIDGLAFYNALRYNGKRAVLLVYLNGGTTWPGSRTSGTSPSASWSTSTTT
jgi:hypothetical protein